MNDAPGLRLTEAERDLLRYWSPGVMDSVWANIVTGVEMILAARAAAPVEAGLAELRASILGLADEAKARQAAYPYHPHWAAWSLYEQDLRDLLRLAPAADGGADWEPLGEDVSMHTMASFHHHISDWRECSFHQRLNAWVFGWPRDKRCLRVDHPSLRRPTPADQNAAESSGSDIEAEVGRDE